MPDLRADLKSRNSARPGSQAPHAPPALTFGLPGKQRVNRVQAGRVLIRLSSTLPGNRNIFTNATIQTMSGSAPPRPFRRGQLLLRAFCRQCDLVLQEVGE